MASSINLEAICITTHLPHGSIYYIASSFESSMCGVLKCCGLVACKLNIRMCICSTRRGYIDSAPALQAL